MKTKRTHPKPRRMPREGWTVAEVIDLLTLGEPPGTCDRCGRDDLRFIHLLDHRAWPESIVTGKCCAQRLTTDYDPTAEHALVLRARRRDRFPDLERWDISARGNPWIKYRGATVTVFPKEEGYACCVALDDDRTYRHGFKTVRDAKLAAFDALVDMLE